jgi:hypothetical protein
MIATYTLLIEKDGTNKFWHTHNGITAGRFAIEGDFTFTIDGNKCKVVEKDGASRFTYLAEHISIKDNTDTGAVETGFSPTSLRNRLRAIGYPKESSVDVLGLSADELDAIHNASGANASNPFATIADLVNGGFNKVLQWNGSTVTVNAGYAGTVFNLSRTAFVNYTVAGTTLTINGADADTGDILQFTSN